MKISVVTVCRNSAATIGYTIESFLRQRQADKEMIVVDGLSTDTTLDIVRSFNSDIIHVTSGPDSGIYDAMNKGVQRCAGDAVGFLNSDDTFHDSNSLEIIAEGLRKADIVFGDLNMVQDHETKRVVRVWRSGAFSRLQFHLGWAAPHPTLYAKRRVFDAVEPFNIKYSIAADYDFMVQALMTRGFSSYYIPATLVDFQIGGMSTNGWRSFFKANLECLDSRRRHLGYMPVDLALFGRPIRRLFQLCLRATANR